MQTQESPAPDITRLAVPIAIIFFMWGFGTGALWVARPLFALALGGTLLQVGLVSALSATPRPIFGPVTGLLCDRWGRRPLLILAAIGHGGILVAQFASTSYLHFVLLEGLAGISIAIWTISSSVLIADITKIASRGRAVAFRDTAMRLGMLAGPIVGGVIAAQFEWRWVFIFIASTKVVAIYIVLFFIPETKPASVPLGATGRPGAIRASGAGIPWAMFRTRSFVAIAAATVCFGMIGLGPGLFRTYYPVHAQETLMLAPDVIGNLVAMGAVLTLLTAAPVGFAVDRFGRKWPLVLGLVLLGAAVYLLGMSAAFIGVAAAFAVFAIAEGMNSNTMQTYAMDLAPAAQRGVFLSAFHVATSSGMIAGPLLAGLLAERVGLETTLIIFTGVVASCVLLFAVLAQETLQRGQRQDSPASHTGFPS
ncbi:MAG: MFS transporter [Chloroflexota bacterium]|nr:MFS transporter [Chloroflexota bacterium]MDE2886161.1 MFS transporter [Chloroflexota bacterium]